MARDLRRSLRQNSRLFGGDNFAAVVNVVLFPLLFVSGALNPATYQVDLMRVALGLPGEFGVAHSLLTLVVTSLVVLSLAAWLFDPEHRFVRRGAAG